jgi:Immunity protein 26
MKTLPYREGSWFVLPLRHDGYAVGIVTRVAPQGRIIMAYFFGPKFNEKPALADVAILQPKDAIMRLRIGDLGLINGDWPLLGDMPNWSRHNWPMPSFVRRDDLSKRVWRTTYSDLDPSKLVSEVPMSNPNEYLEQDALHGAGAVELLLTKQLES